MTTLEEAGGAVQNRAGEAAYHFCKRCMDVVLSALLLAILAPLLALIAAAIMLDSRGSAFFVQERVGSRRVRRNGMTVWEACTFRLYKFRSMRPAADAGSHVTHIRAFVEGRIDPTANGGTFKLTNDRRVTRVGHLLRRTSLDELPQLLNILKGEMSLVGPRPSPTYEVEAYDEWHRRRLDALPGLTGLWQVNGRCELAFDEMIRMDLDYVDSQSLWLDVKILAQTVPAVLSGRGAG